jgi:hypothetical protein
VGSESFFLRDAAASPLLTGVAFRVATTAALSAGLWLLIAVTLR